MMMLGSAVALSLGMMECSCAQSSVRPYSFHVKPGHSLEAVRNAVRALPASNRVNGVEVVLAPGRYVLKSTLQFGQEDGGAENQPVVWRSRRSA